MKIDKAVEIYNKLKPFLRKVRAWGYYLPPKTEKEVCGEKNQNDCWPLKFIPGYPHPPMGVTWNPKRKDSQEITFDDFLKIYKISIDQDF